MRDKIHYIFNDILNGVYIDNWGKELCKSHVLRHGVAENIRTNCNICSNIIEPGTPTLECRICDKDVCNNCMGSSEAQQAQLCCHPKGLQLQVAGKACRYCSFCLAVVQPDGKVLGCSSCHCNICARCSVSLGASPALQETPKNWLYGGCGHPAKLLEGAADDQKSVCSSCKTSIAKGGKIRFCNSCGGIACKNCVKAVQKAAAAVAGGKSSGDSGEKLSRQGQNSNSSAGKAASAAGGKSTNQPPQQPGTMKGGGSGSMTAALPLANANGQGTRNISVGANNARPGILTIGRLPADTKLEVFWDMENRPMALSKANHGSPQQYFDLLTKIFMTDTGIPSTSFALHAFMSVDAQQLLPPGMRDNLNRRHTFVHMHSPLGSSAQGAAKAPGGRQRKEDLHGLDIYMIDAMDKYIRRGANGDVLVIISGDGGYLDTLRKAVLERGMKVQWQPLLRAFCWLYNLELDEREIADFFNTVTTMETCEWSRGGYLVEIQM
eukprot:jgi/Mesvir1/3220/Mv16369-RA.1